MRCQREDCIRTGECWCRTPLVDAAPQSAPGERFCLVTDVEGQRWMCPVDRRREALAQIEGITGYHMRGDFANEDEPAPLGELGWLQRVEDVGRLTFTDPREDL